MQKSFWKWIERVPWILIWVSLYKKLRLYIENKVMTRPSHYSQVLCTFIDILNISVCGYIFSKRKECYLFRGCPQPR